MMLALSGDGLSMPAPRPRLRDTDYGKSAARRHAQKKVTLSPREGALSAVRDFAC
jgi:hypothetical protein